MPVNDVHHLPVGASTVIFNSAISKHYLSLQSPFMKKVTKILVPFELTPASADALKYALQFCKSEFNMEVCVLHVFKPEDEENKEEIELKIQQVLDEVPSFRGKIQTMFSNGNLIDEVIKAQSQCESDLIILGSIKQGTTDVETSSDTAELVLDADCPVLVVPVGTKECKLDHLTLVIDRQEIEDKGTVSFLLAIAQRFNTKVKVLTIYTDEKEFEKDMDDDKIEDVLEYNLGGFYDSHAFLKSSNLLDSILGFAREKEMDLLAILPRNHAVKGSRSQGRLTKLLTLETDIPLLTID